MLSARQMQIYGETYSWVIFQLKVRREAWEQVQKELEVQKENSDSIAARNCLNEVLGDQAKKIQAIDNAIAAVENLNLEQIEEAFWEKQYEADGWSGRVPEGATVMLARQAFGDDVGPIRLALVEDLPHLSYENPIYYVVA